MINEALLILSSPVRVLFNLVPAIITQCEKLVKHTLYISINSQESVTDASDTYPKLLQYTKDIQSIVTEFYRVSLSNSSHLDLYMLIGNIGNHHFIENRLTFDALFLEHHYRNYSKDVVTSLFKGVIATHKLSSHPEIQFLEPFNSIQNGIESEVLISNVDSDSITLTTDVSTSSMLPIYNKCVFGGTFDRLHVGHKILITEACLRCNDALVVGVSDVPNTKKKILPELIEPLETRMNHVAKFIKVVKPSLSLEIMPLVGPFGPSTVYPDLDCIVVSEETLAGGKLVNEERTKKGLENLDIVTVDLINVADNDKISSSSIRRSLLGQLIKPVDTKDLLDFPYCIGLTGGIGSGKSSVATRLERCGAAVIDCDKLGHMAYKQGSNCYHQVVQHFGDDILGPDGEIDRKKLGPKVFSDKTKLEELNNIVWPSILQLAEQKLQEFKNLGQKYIVYDAAVLLEAAWDKAVHEVWVCVVPEIEAVERVMRRNNLSREASLQRVQAQMTNQQRVDKANVVLSTLWSYEETQVQVEKAWSNLLSRTKSR